MLIARVTGNIVATQKHPDYVGQKLLILQACDLDGSLYGSEIIAVDGADTHAGVGDLVLVMQEGGSSRLAARIDHLGPVEYCVVAVVDSITTTQGNLYG